MIRHSPQEIADFFGCYVVQSEKDGIWYVIPYKPTKFENGWAYRYSCDVVPIDKKYIEAPADHDWTHMYEPCVRNTCERPQG